MASKHPAPKIIPNEPANTVSAALSNAKAQVAATAK